MSTESSPVVSLAANGEATRRRSFLPVLIVVVSPESSAEWIRFSRLARLRLNCSTMKRSCRPTPRQRQGRAAEPRGFAIERGCVTAAEPRCCGRGRPSRRTRRRLNGCVLDRGAPLSDGHAARTSAPAYVALRYAERGAFGAAHRAAVEAALPTSRRSRCGTRAPAACARAARSSSTSTTSSSRGAATSSSGGTRTRRSSSPSARARARARPRARTSRSGSRSTTSTARTAACACAATAPRATPTTRACRWCCARATSSRSRRGSGIAAAPTRARGRAARSTRSSRPRAAGGAPLRLAIAASAEPRIPAYRRVRSVAHAREWVVVSVFGAI